MLASSATGQLAKRRVSNKAAKGIQPIPAPAGYPTDLIQVEGGYVQMGLSAKQILDASQRLSHRENDGERMRRITLREAGQEKLLIPAFYMGRHEVTNAQFESFVKDSGRDVIFPFSWWTKEDEAKHRKAHNDKYKGSKPFKPIDYWRANYKKLEWKVPPGTEKYPVGWISYDTARAYCAWAGMRLLTEPEWQRAFYGDKMRPYIFGDVWKRDWLKVLKLSNPREAVPKPVGSVPEARSWCGADDLTAGVWEWTQSPFLRFSGYEAAYRDLKRLMNKSRDLRSEVVDEPDFTASKQLLKGGSYRGWEEADLSFRSYNRFAVGPSTVAEDIGLRVAKSLQPAFDASVLWARLRFDSSCLGRFSLDVPSAKEMRASKRGRSSQKHQIEGIERWDMDGDVVEKHHMISVVSVKELIPPSGKERGWGHKQILEDSSREVPGHHGMPMAALFSTEKLTLDQVIPGGKHEPVDLAPGMYAVYYRTAGLPDELAMAMKAGRRILALNKGVRPGEGSGEEKKDDKKAKKSKKKSKKEKLSAEEQAAAKTWTDVVDRYGIPDEMTSKYPKERPEWITLPGKLRVPVDRDVLLFRKHNGNYVAWIRHEKRPRVRMLASKTPSELKVDVNTGLIEFRGGPIYQSRYKMQIRLPFKVSTEELNKGWVGVNR